MAAQPTPKYDPTVSVLLIDDSPERLELLSKTLGSSDLNILTAASPRDGLDLFCRLRPRIVLVALLMEDISGLAVLDRIMEIDPATEVVIVAGQCSADSAVEAIKKGATDFISIPFSLGELHHRIVKLATRIQERDLFFDSHSDSQTGDVFEEMVGRSPHMRGLFSRIRHVAPHYRTALVLGDTGTGKELVARALHRRSPVSSGRFVVLNCSAVVETLFESELFGHMQGSFTGALRDKPGLFEHAHGGTLFLDEVGDMPPAGQAKLLRVLQDHEVRRVGGLSAREVDVHVVAATNHDLRAEVATRRFREDLYYRLTMVEIHVPRLTDRPGDLVLLTRHLIARFAAQFRKPIRGLTSRAERLLLQHSWPGNIRELENVLGHACMMTASDLVDLEDLPPCLLTSNGHAKRKAPAIRTFDGSTESGNGWREIGDSGPTDSNEYYALAAQERSLIFEALKAASGNQTRAAELLQITRDQLRYRLKKYYLARQGSGVPARPDAPVRFPPKKANGAIAVGRSSEAQFDAFEARRKTSPANDECGTFTKICLEEQPRQSAGRGRVLRHGSGQISYEGYCERVPMPSGQTLTTGQGESRTSS